MGRLAVRKAIQAAVQAATIPYVGTVYPARPTILQEQDYLQTLNGQAIQASQNGSACVVVVHLVNDKRERYVFVGRGAVGDHDVHQVVLELFFACSSGTAVNAQEDYDQVVDALFVQIRNNPTMSAPTVVWSAGEYAAGVVHDQGEPYSPDTGLTVLINGTVRFEAWETIIGTGV